LGSLVPQRPKRNEFIKVVLSYHNLVVKAGRLYSHINKIDLNPLINTTGFDRLKRSASIIRSVHLTAPVVVYKPLNLFAIDSIGFKTNNFVGLFITSVSEALISLLNNIINVVI
jgi:hypothetical protein